MGKSWWEGWVGGWWWWEGGKVGSGGVGNLVGGGDAWGLVGW